MGVPQACCPAHEFVDAAVKKVLGNTCGVAGYLGKQRYTGGGESSAVRTLLRQPRDHVCPDMGPERTLQGREPFGSVRLDGSVAASRMQVDVVGPGAEQEHVSQQQSVDRGRTQPRRFLDDERQPSLHGETFLRR